MKNRILFTLALACATYGLGQTSNSNPGLPLSLEEQIDHIFDPLDVQSCPTNILVDKGINYIDLSQYTGSTSTATENNYNIFSLGYLSLQTGQFGVTPHSTFSNRTHYATLI